MKKGFFIVFTASFALVFLFVIQYFQYEDGKLHIYICDVGQGDGILIKTPNSAEILIDSGPDKSIINCLSSYMPFWDREVEAGILSHPHADHFTGFIDVIKRYKLKSFYTNSLGSDTQTWKILQDQIAEKRVSAKYLHSGNYFSEKNSLRLKVIWPNSDFNSIKDQKISYSDINSSSIVILLSYGKFEVLLSGDAESQILSAIQNEIKDIDVFKVGHHGSKDALSDSLLYSLNPEVAVISVGENNKFGHPHKSTLDLAKKHKVSVLRTDKDGTIHIVSDGKKWWVK